MFIFSHGFGNDTKRASFKSKNQREDIFSWYFSNAKD